MSQRTMRSQKPKKPTKQTVLGEVRDDVQHLKSDMKHVKNDVKHLKEDVQHLKGDVKQLKEDVQHLKGDVKQLKEDVQIVKLRVASVSLGLSNLETRVDKGFASIDQKFNAVFEMLDRLAKKMDDKRDEQTSQFANYKILDQKIETHDKDISRIKLRLKMAAA